MGRRQRLGVPPIHCSARSKRTHEQCRDWATPGTLVCRLHGGESPGALARARVRLTFGEVRTGRGARALAGWYGGSAAASPAGRSAMSVARSA
jgi:hypothetical protein